MNIDALLFMVIIQVSVTITMIYFLYKVLKKPLQKDD